MMRQWAIVVGLDNYQLFQPLSCAQRDAQALHQFLIDEARFPAQQCLLFTDTSPQIWGKPTAPTRINLLSWIELLVQNCFKPGDSLWFFFSGYGVCSQSKDYLVPLDGDPFAIETTCIPMSLIFTRLQASLLPGMPLVLLDISRSQGTFSSENVGNQTAQLAKQLAIPTILSCQPGQFSREISSLGHGLFTAALLEGLQYHQGATPSTLMRFLSDRLPELGAHYYLPNQQPLTLCPSERLHQPLLQTHFSSQWNGTSQNGSSTQATGSPMDAIPLNRDGTRVAPQSVAPQSTVDASFPPASSNGASVSENPFPSPQEVAASMAGKDASGFSQFTHSSDAAIAAAVTQTPHSQSSFAVSRSPFSPSTPPSQPPHAANSLKTEDDATSSTLWRPILLWGSLLSLGLIGCVLWRNWSLLQAPSQPAIGKDSTAATVQSSVSPTATGNEQSAPSSGSDAIQSTSATVDGSSTNHSAAPSPGVPQDRVLSFNPTEQNKLTGQAILDRARKQVLSDQATPYRDAIDEAAKIPPDDPAYVDAQQDIAIWSQTIFDIAQRRASQQQWDIAIMAADLVPIENKKLRPQAQAAIAQWCPTVRPLPITGFAIQQAKNICSQQPI
ncbi:MAG: caspase family protein [Oscillatoriales cyanobacterium C42_A2020_001]|nr:caspase family protein [Leptolyngbyaceae cyanobacterium C42_A2020_001]